MYVKTCNYCGTKYNAFRRDAKTCSTKCRVALSVSRKTNNSAKDVNSVVSVSTSVYVNRYTNYYINEFVNEGTAYLRHKNNLFIRIAIWNYNDSFQFPNFDIFLSGFYLLIKPDMKDFLLIQGKTEYPVYGGFLDELNVYVNANKFNYWVYQNEQLSTFIHFEDEEIQEGFSMNGKLEFSEDRYIWGLVDQG